MLGTVERLYIGLINALAGLAAILIVFSIGFVILNVISRALGYGAFQAAIATVEYILLYFTLLSAPYLLHNGGHVMVDMIIKNMTGLSRRLLESAIYIVGMVVCTTFAVVSIQIMSEAIERGFFDERSVDVPYWLLYMLYPLCFGLLTVEFGRFLFTSRGLYKMTDSREGL